MTKNVFHPTMQKRWLQKTKPDTKVVQALAASLNIDSKLAALLSLRGVQTFEEAKNFFRPELSDLHPPLLMKDMDKAVARLEQAIANNENVLIYGDYDVDGTTAVAFLFSFLKTLPWGEAHVDFYIPDRYNDNTTLSAEVKSNEANKFDFDLKK